MDELKVKTENYKRICLEIFVTVIWKWISFFSIDWCWFYAK